MIKYGKIEGDFLTWKQIFPFSLGDFDTEFVWM
jgi:hypothetical protein